MKQRIGNFARGSALIAGGLFLLASNIASLKAQTVPPTAIRGTVGLLKDRDLIVATAAGDVRVVVSTPELPDDRAAVRFPQCPRRSEETGGLLRPPFGLGHGR